MSQQAENQLCGYERKKHRPLQGFFLRELELRDSKPGRLNLPHATVCVRLFLCFHLDYKALLLPVKYLQEPRC